MESSIINILNYLFKTKNVSKEVQSLKFFFGDALSFPEFVNLIFNTNVEGIKNDINMPMNNKLSFKKTLDVLIKKDPYFVQFNKMGDPKNNEELLMAIFTRVCFTMTKDEIFNKANSILENSNKPRYKNPDDIFCGKFLISLLNIVTDGKVPVKDKITENIIISSLQKAEVPVVVNSYSFDPDNPNLFLIQIQIIFEIYSKIISEITKKFNLFSSMDLRKGANNKDPTFQTKPLNKSKNCFPFNCYMNIVNQILNESSEAQINDLYDLYTTDINKLVISISIFSGYNIIYQPHLDRNGLLTKIAKTLGIHQKFDFDSKSEFDHFIKLIFNFNSDKKDEILKLCNKIFIDYGFSTTIEDVYLSKGYEYFVLIHRLILTHFKVLKFDLIPRRNQFTFEFLQNAFKRFNISFILSEESFSEKNEFLLFYQLKILLDKFEPGYKADLLKYSRICQNNKYLIPAINSAGLKNGLFVPSIQSFLRGNLFQFFVEGLIEKNVAEECGIEVLKNDEESERNICKIFEYLQKQKEIFNTLTVDLNQLIKNPAFGLKILQKVIRLLLDLYFVRNTESLLERCNKIIGLKIRVKEVKDLGQVGVYFYLLHFLSDLNFKVEIDFENYSIKEFTDAFKRAGVNMIIEDRCIRQVSTYQNYIFYQLRAIFNRLDELSCINPSFIIIERFLASLNIFNKSKIINSAELRMFCSNIAIRCEVQKSRQNTEIDKEALTKSMNFKLNNKNATKTFDEKVSKLKIIPPPDRKNYRDNLDHFDFLAKFEVDLKPFYEFQLKDKTILFCPKINEIAKGTTSLTDELKKMCPLLNNYKRDDVSSKQRIYRILNYNEIELKWMFNTNEYLELIKDYNFGINNRNTCLISFININVDDLLVFNPNISKSDFDTKQLFVYGYRYDGNDTDKKINPIYLFLYVPDKRKNDRDILEIVMQVYIFLYGFSDIQIVLGNNNCFFDQINLVSILNNLQREFSFGQLKSTLYIVNTFTDPNKSFFNLHENGITQKYIYMNYYAKKSEFYKFLNGLIIQFQPISFYDIFLRLDEFSKFDLFSLYIKLRSQLDKTNEYLNNLIKLRMNKLISKECIDYEFSWIPTFDVKFSLQYQSIFYNQIKGKSKAYVIYDIYKEDLNRIASQYFKCLKELCFTKIYMRNDEISMLLNQFEAFLDESFESIIKNSHFSLISHKVYRDCYYILDEVKKGYMKNLNIYFKKFVMKINQRNNEINRNFDDEFKNSTRYTINVVEHIKEIKCEIEVGKKLEDEISQDF